MIYLTECRETLALGVGVLLGLLLMLLIVGPGLLLRPRRSHDP